MQFTSIASLALAILSLALCANALADDGGVVLEDDCKCKATVDIVPFDTVSVVGNIVPTNGPCSDFIVTACGEELVESGCDDPMPCMFSGEVTMNDGSGSASEGDPVNGTTMQCGDPQNNVRLSYMTSGDVTVTLGFVIYTCSNCTR